MSGTPNISSAVINGNDHVTFVGINWITIQGTNLGGDVALFLASIGVHYSVIGPDVNDPNSDVERIFDFRATPSAGGGPSFTASGDLTVTIVNGNGPGSLVLQNISFPAVADAVRTPGPQTRHEGDGATKHESAGDRLGGRNRRS